MLKALAGLVLAFALSGCGAGGEKTGYAALARGAMRDFEIAAKPAPASALPLGLADGAPGPKLADLRPENGILLVNLWATWCPPCVEEMPTIARLAVDYKEKGLVVAAISVDGDAERALAAQTLADLSQGALTFYQDPRYAIAFEARAKGFPTTILYGRDGAEVGRLAGAADWSSPEARALIDAALNGANASQ